MRMSRREWLSISAGSALAAWAPSRRAAAQHTAGATADRIARVIREFEQQGFHRTGTDVDLQSGDWLREQVRQAGAAPASEPFPLSRVDLIANVLVVGDRRIEGVPLFDGTFTDARGVPGRLGSLGSDAEIGLAETAVNAAGRGPLGDARRAHRHKAIVAVTRGRRPGLCPSNAESFLQPFGPPVLQVSSEDAAWLGEQASRGAEGRLIAQVTRTAATAVNVTAAIQGVNPALAPLVVMTPRSGWYWCASERGGGIACWLEVMRALQRVPPARSILFVASSGHELGHLGINAFVDRRPGIVAKAAGWMHFGANVGAATDPSNLVQSSDDDFDAMLSRAMAASGLEVNRRAPRGTVPTGEAEVVHRGGGRYVSIVGGSALFHHVDDRGPQAVDPVTIAKFSDALIAVAATMTAA